MTSVTSEGTNETKTKTEMVELFEERLFECVLSYKHIYNVTSPGHRDRELLKNSWEEIGLVLVVLVLRQ